MNIKEKVLALANLYLCEELKGYYHFTREGVETRNEYCEYYEFSAELETLLEDELYEEDIFFLEEQTLFDNPSLVLGVISVAFTTEGVLYHFLFPLVTH